MQNKGNLDRVEAISDRQNVHPTTMPIPTVQMISLYSILSREIQFVLSIFE